MTRRVLRAVAGASSVLAVAGLAAGCGAVDGARQRAEEKASAAVESAVKEQASEQARKVLDEGLEQLQEDGGTCAEYAALSAEARQEEMTALLRAFWLAELVTDAPGDATEQAYAAAVDAGCADQPDTPLATVVQSTYDGGDFGP